MSDMQREVRQIGSLSDWLEWRTRDITASRIAALFGEHPYMSFGQLVMQMRGETQRRNASMRLGRIWEPAVLEALREDHKELGPIVKATTYHRLPEHRLGCTPDAWAGLDALVQAKTVSPWEWDKWHGKPCLAYILQTLTEMMVTGKDKGFLAIMIMSSSYPVHLFPIERNEAAEQRILNAVAQFWEGYEADAPAEQNADALREMLDDGSHADLSDDNEIRELLDRRWILKEQEKVTTELLRDLDTSIKDKIGNASTAHVPGWLLTYRSYERKAFSVPAKNVRSLHIKRIDEDTDDE